MGLTGKRVAQINIRGNEDVFHDLIRYRPYDLSKISPSNVLGCELQEGEWGAIGSIIIWTYLIDGKQQASKQVVEAVDEEKKAITVRPIGGDLMQIYKSFTVNIQVNQDGENSFVTWTFVFEKMSEVVPDPDFLIELASKVTKDIESHQFQLQ